MAFFISCSNIFFCLWEFDWHVAVLGLVGTQVLWVGSWDILSRESRTYNYDEEDDGWSLLPNTATVRISYLIIGIAMVVMVDSLYSNAGMDTPLNPREGLVPPFMRWWNRQFSSPTQRAVRSGLRAFLAFIGMMLIWVYELGLLSLTTSQNGGGG